MRLPYPSLLLVLALSNCSAQATNRTDACHAPSTQSQASRGTYSGTYSGGYPSPVGFVPFSGSMRIEVDEQSRAQGTSGGQTRTSTGHGSTDSATFSGNASLTSVLVGARGISNLSVDRVDCTSMGGRVLPGPSAGGPLLQLSGRWEVRRSEEQQNPQQRQASALVEESRREHGSSREQALERARLLINRAAEMGKAGDQCLSSQLLDAARDVLLQRLNATTARYGKDISKMSPDGVRAILGDLRDVSVMGLGEDCEDVARAWETLRRAIRERVKQAYEQPRTRENLRDLVARLRDAELVGALDDPLSDPRFQAFAQEAMSALPPGEKARAGQLLQLK